MTEHRDLPPEEWHGSASITGSGSPVGSVTPQKVGEHYFDLTGPAMYLATGLTNADWVNITTGAAGATKGTVYPQFFDRDNNNSFDRALRFWEDDTDGESVKSGWNAGNGGYFVVPFDNALLTGGVLTALGLAVSPGSVTYPLTFRIGVWRQDTGGSTLLANLDFDVPGSVPMGVFNNSGGTTSDARGLAATAALALTKGDLIGLRYDFDTAGNRINAARHTRVVLQVVEQ